MIIQTKYQYSDRELVEQLTENPYYQYFIGLPGYQEEASIDASTLVLFRKRLKSDVIMEVNEYMLADTKEKDFESEDKNNDITPPTSDGGTVESDASEDSDNKGTLMLDATCAPAKIKKRSTKKIRATIRKQFSYVHSDIKYLGDFMAEGYAPRMGAILALR